jgi:hypothetical protein
LERRPKVAVSPTIRRFRFCHEPADDHMESTRLG